ncbi:hypothetical protein KCTCHS21_01620 [Cohnella abietis]|uniref:Uncharacterized protein n=2 Tax=Cohnella abietis TaxID=2507935 RepID=A0A3T1CY44_9BACL|nr:hypothetical protein KCTCHS21_01620 [Cohnella abietis]
MHQHISLESLNRYIIQMETQAVEVKHLIEAIANSGKVSKETVEAPQADRAVQQTKPNTFSLTKWLVITAIHKVSDLLKYIIWIAAIFGISFGTSYLMNTKNNPEAPAGELLIKTAESFSVAWTWAFPIIEKLKHLF